MSRYFVNDPPVAIPEWDGDSVISETRPNVIYIRSRMDVETRGKVSSELVSMDAAGRNVEMHLGQNQTALLIHNIVRWGGPDFDGVPCDAAHIRTLDPTEPHIERVLEEIDRRNTKKVAPSPKPPTESGYATNGLHDASPASAAGLSLQLATGTPRPGLRSVLAGHRTRSDDSTPTT